MSSTTRTSLKERSLLKMGALLLAGGLVATACGSDTVDVADADTTTTTVAAMDDDATDELAMADDAMLGAFGPACDAVPTDGDGSFAGMADDPAGTAASNNPLLSTLVTAAGAADLVDTLNSEGPFTIFAPTNDAFAKIDADTLDGILADKALLTSILTYHVVGGQSSLATDLDAAGSLATVEGGEISFGADGTMVNDANVICSNVPVSNGTVHIIDSVLLPQVALDALAAGSDDAMDDDAMDEAMLGASGPDCAAVPADGDGSFAGMADDPAGTAASNNPLLSTLVTAAGAADLVDTLNSEGPFTIFAPTNDAFAKIDPATLDAVLADKALLTSILTNHVIAGDSLSAEALAEAGTLTTVNGTDLTFDIDGQLMINGVVTSGCQNVPVANGTVHIIDTVLLPEG